MFITEAVKEAHLRWRAHLRPGDGVVDATIGNGKDLFLLSQLTLPHPDGYVAGFDIQAQAFAKTQERLNKLPLDQKNRVHLHLRSHEEINPTLFPFPPRLIVYNLGYLPGGDRSIITQQESTLASLRAALPCLAPRGALSIVCYSGHPGGQPEEEAVWQWAQALPSHQWRVECLQYNRPTSPTFVWCLSL